MTLPGKGKFTIKNEIWGVRGEVRYLLRLSLSASSPFVALPFVIPPLRCGMTKRRAA